MAGFWQWVAALWLVFGVAVPALLVAALVWLGPRRLPWGPRATRPVGDPGRGRR